MDHIKEYRDKWFEIEISTSETDLERTGNIVKEVYQVRGYPPPSHIVIVNSPLECLFASTHFNKRKVKFREIIRNLLHPHFSKHQPTGNVTGYPPHVAHPNWNKAYNNIARDLEGSSGRVLVLVHTELKVNYRG